MDSLAYLPVSNKPRLGRGEHVRVGLAEGRQFPPGRDTSGRERLHLRPPVRVLGFPLRRPIVADRSQTVLNDAIDFPWTDVRLQVENFRPSF